MIFLFPKKKIILDCFTCSKAVIETTPIHNAIKHIPEWWKKLPDVYYKTFFPTATMKGCVGMIDYYASSIAIPLWSDLMINVDSTKNYQWQFSDAISNAKVHDMEQRNNFLNNHGHLKLIAPWYLKCKKNIKWLWSQPIYNFYSDIVDIKILPAILDFKKQCGINVNIMFPSNQPKKYFLKHGQVLAHLTPLSEYKVKVVRHLVGESEYRKIGQDATAITFINKYKTFNKQREKFSDCPYKED